MKSNKHFSVYILLILIVCCFFSCNKSVTDSDFISKLDIIDVNISAGHYDSAKKSLKKLEDSALSSYQRLGVIKRYFQLGEKKSAESFLVKSLKKLPDNLELNAVYSQFLLREGRLEEAEIYSKKLIGSQYASLYSENLFSKNLDNNQYFSPKYIQLYLDAAFTTGNSLWLKNAAAISAKIGTLDEALSYKPTTFSKNDSPYFWALLEYDTENYVSAFETLDLCDNTAEVLKLKSDCLLQLNEIDYANDFWLASIQENESAVPLEVYYNATAFAMEKEDYEKSYNLLTSLVKYFPYSEKALALYGDFSLLIQAIRNENNSEMVKTSSLKTIYMEKVDSYPKIPSTDVLYKMEKALEENYSSELLIEYMQFKWIVENTSEENVIIDIWRLLENTSENNIYDEYILNFALAYFSSHHMENEANGLFVEYINQKYGQEDFGVYASDFDIWEAEMAAWYSVKNENYTDAVRLYESLCYEKTEVPSYHIQLNLGALYTALGEEQKALEVYKNLASKSITSLVASEVHYRIGSIQFDLNDKKNALLSLNYSIKLNPDNHKARLLLKQMN